VEPIFSNSKTVLNLSRECVISRDSWKLRKKSGVKDGDLRDLRKDFRHSANSCDARRVMQGSEGVEGLKFLQDRITHYLGGTKAGAAVDNAVPNNVGWEVLWKRAKNVLYRFAVGVKATTGNSNAVSLTAINHLFRGQLD
jgi:hypothetical protein